MSYTAIKLRSMADADAVEMLKQHLAGKPIYVRFTADEEKREGAIGIVREWNRATHAVSKNGERMDPSYRSYYNRYQKPNVHNFEIDGDKYEVDLTDLGAFWGRIGWDNRKNECQGSCYNLEWLKDYEGPCVWIYGKPEKPQVVPKDRLGREIKVGDFCCYILHHFHRSYGASTQFGTVTKIDRDGSVHAKNIALSDDEASAVKKVNDNATIVILTKDLMDRLMMAKLAAL